jgi:predicted secreted hydrolase
LRVLGRGRLYWLVVLFTLMAFSACDVDNPEKDQLETLPDSSVETLQPGTVPTSLAEFLHDDSNDGFKRAVVGRPLEFPRDHGPHPGFRAGWWYFTGNLKTDTGRSFGYQLTFFRIALKPGQAKRTSAWGSQQIYMAHFAITDIAAGQFYRQQRLARSGLKLAGTQAEPFSVWLEDWRVDSARGDTFLPLRLIARAKTEHGEIALDLQLDTGKPRVLQGQRGYSPKSQEPGNASYYYSYTRLPSRGSVSTPAGQFQVRGQSWFDREWSTSALSKQQSGWDWFALQLEDGRDLMLYRLRLRHGGTDPNSAGVLVESNGQVRRIQAQEFKLRPLRYWHSPQGRRYPLAWELEYGDLHLKVEPRLDSQAYTRGIPYWEGAVEVMGRDASTPVTGLGYLELSGY